jgi:hypothetical protein
MRLTPEQYELIRYSGSYLMDQCGYRYTSKAKRWPKVTDKFEISPEIMAELDAKLASGWTEPNRPMLGLFGPPSPDKEAESWVGASYPFLVWLLAICNWYVIVALWLEYLRP